MRRTAGWVGALAGIVCATGCGGSGPAVDAVDHSVSPSPERVTALTASQTASVIFGPADVPDTWKTSSDLATTGRESDGNVATARRGYRAPDLATLIGFGAASYQTVPDAVARYQVMKQQGADGSERSVSVTGADEALQTSCDGCGGSIVFRVGTVVAWVNLNPDGHGAPRTSSIGAFASALAERIRQVFNGQRPTVSVR